jgi:molybdopterin-guanine dinucleotide biosynthesis protein A
MKQDKAFLSFPEGTLIERIISQTEGHFEEVLISVTEKEKFQFLSFPLIEDEKPDQGPMMGIRSALAASKNEKNFIMSCDIPDANLIFMEKLISLAKESEAVVPISPEGRKEPLFAVYSRGLIPKMERLLEEEVRSLIVLLEESKTRYVRMEDGSRLTNLNTWEDYLNYLRSL